MTTEQIVSALLSNGGFYTYPKIQIGWIDELSPDAFVIGEIEGGEVVYFLWPLSEPDCARVPAIQTSKPRDLSMSPWPTSARYAASWAIDCCRSPSRRSIVPDSERIEVGAETLRGMVADAKKLAASILEAAEGRELTYEGFDVASQKFIFRAKLQPMPEI